MILDPTVPEVIATHFPEIIHPFLADFGISKVLDKEQKTRSFVGTPEYVAPEIIL